MQTATIFNIMRYSIHDGPGIRTTVFFKGCPLKCQWCHNPESISPKIESYMKTEKRSDAPDIEKEEIVGYEINTKELMKELEKDNLFYEQSGGGVTFSGGEPFYQSGFLLEMLRLCKDNYIKTAIDTSGFVKTETIVEAAKLANLFLFDIKFADSEKHKSYCGARNELIWENLRAISKEQAKIFIRIPVIPGINDSKEEMTAICEKLTGLKIAQVNLLPYHNLQTEKYKRLGVEYKLPELQNLDNEDLTELKELFESYNFIVKLGG